MKIRIAAFALTALLGCSDDGLPTDPWTLDAEAPMADSGPLGLDAGPPPDMYEPPPPPAFEIFIEDPSLDLVRDVWSGPGATWFVTGNAEELFTPGSGQILRWTGGADVDAWNVSDRLYGVHGTASGDVWVVGEAGLVADYDGADGFDLQRPINGDFFATWGSETERYVAGENWGRLEVATAPFTSFGPMYIDGARGDTIRCLGGTAAGLWACDEEACYGYDAAAETWHVIMSSDSFDCDIVAFADRGALILGSRAVYAVDFERILLEGGFGPTSLPIPAVVDRGDVRLRGIWTEEGSAWIVGTNGYVAVNETYLTSPLGGSWRQVDVPTDADLHSIHGDGDTIWIGGDGVILRRARR